MQFVTLLEPSRGENEFEGHKVHVSSDISADSVEYFPFAQAVHELDPLTSLYVPDSHELQLPPSGPVNPTLHVQFLRNPLRNLEKVFSGQSMQVLGEVFAIPVEYLPAGHMLHSCDPFELLYEPLPHAAHARPFGPK